MADVHRVPRRTPPADAEDGDRSPDRRQSRQRHGRRAVASGRPDGSGSRRILHDNDRHGRLARHPPRQHHTTGRSKCREAERRRKEASQTGRCFAGLGQVTRSGGIFLK